MTNVPDTSGVYDRFPALTSADPAETNSAATEIVNLFRVRGRDGHRWGRVYDLLFLIGILERFTEDVAELVKGCYIEFLTQESSSMVTATLGQNMCQLKACPEVWQTTRQYLIAASSFDVWQELYCQDPDSYEGTIALERVVEYYTLNHCGGWALDSLVDWLGEWCNPARPLTPGHSECIELRRAWAKIILNVQPIPPINVISKAHPTSSIHYWGNIVYNGLPGNCPEVIEAEKRLAAALKKASPEELEKAKEPTHPFGCAAHNPAYQQRLQQALAAKAKNC